MVIIRLRPGGKKKTPFYQIVAADNRMPLTGRFIERMGFYNALKTETQSLWIDLERINHWVSQGAQVSPAVKSLCKAFKKSQESASA
ncbi:MAG: 30S ribosomal protein S16 [Gammaproteobacteria bacterium]|nr:30S ribosomal protein S16 [Gammaproteobacteria bacterium]